jgi:hypothetical protein
MDIIPFPRAKHDRFLAHHVDYMSGTDMQTAEEYMERMLDVERRAMFGLGIAPARIERELTGLRAAIFEEYRKSFHNRLCDPA